MMERDNCSASFSCHTHNYNVNSHYVHVLFTFTTLSGSADEHTIQKILYKWEDQTNYVWLVLSRPSFSLL